MQPSFLTSSQLALLLLITANLAKGKATHAYTTGFIHDVEVVDLIQRGYITKTEHDFYLRTQLGKEHVIKALSVVPSN
jgi:hypothetical protein